MKVSQFDSVWSKSSTDVSMREIMRKVKTGACKSRIEALRECINNQGSAAKVKRLKDGLPCFVPIGCCRGGHARKNLVSLSGLLCFDFDHTDGRTVEVRTVSATLPHVVAAFVSPSGHGVKVLVKVRPEDEVADYDTLYHSIGRWLSSRLQHPYDLKCGISTQPCFFSYDPEAFYRPDVEPYKVEIANITMENAPEPPPSPLQAATVQPVGNADELTGYRQGSSDVNSSTSSSTVQPVGNADEMTDHRQGSSSNEDASASADQAGGSMKLSVPAGSSLLGGSASADSHAGNSALNGAAGNQPLSAPGFIRSFVDRFEHANPFVRGDRNNIALKLGREAAHSGFSREELDEMCNIFAERHYSDDFTRRDILSRVYAGYQYFMENQWGPNWVQKVHKVQGSPRTYSGNDIPDFLPSEEDGNSDDELLDDTPEGIRYHNNELRKNSPLIPSEVFATMPEFLRRCTAYASSARERDLMLLCTLCCCGVMLPRVYFLYAMKSYSPHFYLGFVAPPASGKGVSSAVSHLLDATQKYYDELNASRMKEYEKQKWLWETKGKKRGKSRKGEQPEAEYAEQPEEPQYIYLKLPPVTSKGRFVQSVKSAGDVGVIMLTTEIMSITSSVKQDYGHFEDVLLKAAHHEEISSAFKTDGAKPIVASKPHVAVCMSGTQEQFNNFFQTLEAGLFSRFALYTLKQEFEWRSCEPDENETDLDTVFTDLGKELYPMHRKLLERPVQVKFTHEQWCRHTEHFTRLTQRHRVTEQESTSSILFRNGVLTCRLASLFTIFRQWDDYLLGMDTLTCTDVDFDNALRIAETLLQHSFLLSTALPQSKNAPVAMKKADELEMVLSKLPELFTYSEFIRAAVDMQMSTSSAKRMLKRAKEAQIIVKEGDKYRKNEKRDF